MPTLSIRCSGMCLLLSRAIRSCEVSRQVTAPLEDHLFEDAIHAYAAVSRSAAGAYLMIGSSRTRPSSDCRRSPIPESASTTIDA